MTDLKQQDDVQPELKPQPKAPRTQSGGGENGTGNGVATSTSSKAPPTAAAQRPPTPEEVVDSLRFMFAVGIECSNPTVAGNVRVDQLEATGHYDNWKKDLRL